MGLRCCEPRFFGVVRLGVCGGTRWLGIDTAAGFVGWLSAAVSVPTLVCYSGGFGGFFAVGLWRPRADILRSAFGVHFENAGMMEKAVDRGDYCLSGAVSSHHANDHDRQRQGIRRTCAGRSGA